MQRIPILLSACLLCAVAGCRSYQYQGETFPATQKVEVFEQKTPDIPPHKVMGHCMVEGPYDLRSRDALVRRLRSVARDKGADAILLTGSRVIAEGAVAGRSPWAFLSDNAAYAQMERDFDGGYGAIKKDEQRTLSYRRILRADFLRYTGEAKKAAPPQKEIQKTPAAKNEIKKIPDAPNNRAPEKSAAK